MRTVAQCLLALGMALLAYPLHAAKDASQTKATSMVTINGSPLRINVGSDTAFQVFNATLPNPNSGQLFPSGSALGNAGFYVHEAQTTIAYFSFTNQQLGAVTGTGSVNSPLTVISNGGTGLANLDYRETVTYLNGDNFFSKRLTLTNRAASSRTLRVFLYGDIFLASSDAGVPFLQTQAGAPGGQTCPGQAPYTILFIPRSPAASAYQAGNFSTVRSSVLAGSLDNSVSTGCIDNGAALQWNLVLPANGTASVEAIVSFGAIPGGVIIPTLNMSATPASAPVSSTSTIAWNLSTNDASCTPSGGVGTNWAQLGNLPTSGARLITLPASPGVLTFTLSCNTGFGNPVVASTTVTVTGASTPVAPPPPVLRSQTTGLNGQPANNFSGRPVVADRASFVAFESAASNLVAGDSNNAQDIFVRNRATNALLRASVDSNGGQLIGLVSGEPAIARDGVRLVFVAGNGISQVDGVSAKRRVTNGQVRVFDSRTAKGNSISNAPNGTPGNGASNNPHVVDNVVVFQSEATNLTAQSDTNGIADIYAHDLTTGITSLLSAPNTATQNTAKAAGCGSGRPKITANGIVVFESCQILSTGASTTTFSNIYATTVTGKRSVLITRGASGVPGNADSNNATVSSDGSFVFFDSAANNLVAADSNGRRDVFRARLTLSGTSLSVGPVERVSVSLAGAQADGTSERPATCGDGRYATFESDATNLFSPPGGPVIKNILAKDMLTGVVAKLSQTSTSVSASGISSEPALSPDCSAVAFATEANNLSSGAQSGSPDVVLGSNPLNRNYTGHWHNATESGWGLTIAHQGDVLFPNWFTFDADGKPLWLGMIAGARLATDGSYSGAIYRLRGVPFNLINGSQAFTTAPIVGQGKLTFSATNRLTFEYTVGTVNQTKILEPLFFRQATVCEFAPSTNLASASNFTDVWNTTSEPGWGIYLGHQRDTLFGLWYTYDSTGRDQWLTATAIDPSGGNVFAGDLRRLTGTPFSSINGSQAFLTAPVVGSVSFAFVNGAQATMTYTLEGVTQTKVLSRYVFGSPVSLCRNAAGQTTSSSGLQSLTR